MDLLNGDIKKIFFKYLAAAFGSTFTVSVYGIVDSMCVGRYHGPAGSASLSVAIVIWCTYCSLGLLTGIGGSIHFSSWMGHGDKNKANQYFTTAIGIATFIAVVLTGAFGFFTEEILILLGAEDPDVLYCAVEYFKPMKYAFFIFMVNEMLAAFLRNDGDPLLTTAAVVTGGAFNIFGDFYFVFGLDMGARGAGFATFGGGLITFSIMMTHFFKKKNTYRFVKVTEPFKKIADVVKTGFAPCFLDLASAILTTIFNIRVSLLLGTAAFAVLGVVSSINSFALCCAYAVGQAAQPIISLNYGAGKWERIGPTMKYAISSTIVIGAIFYAFIFFEPNLLVRLFMTPTEEVLEIAPAILRTYCSSYVLMNVNIFATYYFQSIMKDGISFIVSVSRGLVLSGILALVLPVIFGPSSIWLAVPIADIIVLIAVIIMIKKVNGSFGEDSPAAGYDSIH